MLSTILALKQASVKLEAIHDKFVLENLTADQLVTPKKDQAFAGKDECLNVLNKEYSRRLREDVTRRPSKRFNGHVAASVWDFSDL